MSEKRIGGTLLNPREFEEREKNPIKVFIDWNHNTGKFRVISIDKEGEKSMSEIDPTKTKLKLMVLDHFSRVKQPDRKAVEKGAQKDLFTDAFYSSSTTINLYESKDKKASKIQSGPYTELKAVTEANNMMYEKVLICATQKNVVQLTLSRTAVRSFFDFLGRVNLHESPFVLISGVNKEKNEYGKEGESNEFIHTPVFSEFKPSKSIQMDFQKVFDSNSSQLISWLDDTVAERRNKNAVKTNPVDDERKKDKEVDEAFSDDSTNIEDSPI